MGVCNSKLVRSASRQDDNSPQRWQKTAEWRISNFNEQVLAVQFSTVLARTAERRIYALNPQALANTAQLFAVLAGRIVEWRMNYFNE